ncbi:MAG: hypothetical protein JW878_08460 [Methanomicrobia archaeon]|nr:hypothetical protein [Methanomicrobia archaeon]
MKQARVAPKGPIKWVIPCLLFRTATSMTKAVTAAATAVNVSQATANKVFGAVTSVAQRIAKELLSFSEVWDVEPGRHRELKRRKRCVLFLLVLLFAIGTPLLAPAAPAPAPAPEAGGDTASVTAIDMQLKLVDEDPVINAFLYERMYEYNESEGLEAVKIVVVVGPQWARTREVKTFYIVRNATRQEIDIRASYDDDDGSLWTFYPHTGQTVYALKVLQSHQATVQKLLHLMVISVVIDTENVPAITEITDKSPWMSGYLADKDKEFLEQFVVAESNRAVGIMQQVMQWQTVDRMAYKLLIPI